MRIPRLAGFLAAFCLLIAALAASPFLLTTGLIRFALHRAFPAASVDLGGAELSPAGTLVLRDIALNDSAPPAPRPLVSVREATVVFAWSELLSRRVRQVRVEDLTLYTRSNEPSQLAVLDAFSQPSTGAPPFWVDALDVRGRVQHQDGGGSPPSSGAWPLTARMTMSGERSNPSRRFQLAIGAVDASAKASGGGFAVRAEVDTEPEPGGTRVVVRRLTARDAALAAEADAVRRYAPKLPADLNGQIDSSLKALDLNGTIDLRAGGGSAFHGDVRLRDLSVHAAGKQPFALERLTIAGNVESPLDRWTPAALKLSGFTARLPVLRYGQNAVEDFDASWRVEGQTVVAEHFGFRIFGGRVSGAPAWNFATNAVTRCDLEIKSLDAHQALANLSPENLDAEGRVSGILHLLTGPEGQLTGHLDLAFDGPGTLSIGEIEQVKQMLVGNFGLDLANLALHDLRRYPFKEGRLYLESVGTNSELRLKFVRQPRTDADTVPPRKEVINGQEIWVGSLVVPTIDMTVPITGKSLGEILAMVSGFRPLIETASVESGK